MKKNKVNTKIYNFTTSHINMYINKPHKSLFSQQRKIFWFNDYRVSKVFKSTLFKFDSNFDEFLQPCHRNIGLKTAMKEALKKRKLANEN